MNPAPLMAGLFKDRDATAQAVDAIVARGYRADEIDLVMSEETRRRCFAEQPAGPLGRIASALTTLDSPILLPGMGLVAAGPLAQALAETGVVVGDFIGRHIPGHRLREYESGVRSGGFVLGIRPRSSEDAEYFEREWGRHRGHAIHR